MHRVVMQPSAGAENARKGQGRQAEALLAVAVRDEAQPKQLRLGPNVAWRREMP